MASSPLPDGIVALMPSLLGEKDLRVVQLLRLRFVHGGLALFSGRLEGVHDEPMLTEPGDCLRHRVMDVVVLAFREDFRLVAL